jgi:hypothetical protein
VLDASWAKGRLSEAVTPSLRSDGLANLRLPLRGTGLEPEGVFPGGCVDQATGEHRSPVLLDEAMSYVAALRPARSPAAWESGPLEVRSSWL